MTGYFNGTSTYGSFALSSSGGNDVFIAKLDISGNFLWAKKAGGTNSDIGKCISIDNSGNCYVTGYFEGATTFGNIELIGNGNSQYDMFVAKLDTNGNWLWARKAGGTSHVYSNGISTDSNGNSYVTGYFWGSATFGSTSLNSSGQTDIFIIKLDLNGNYLWAKKAGGSNVDNAHSVATDVFLVMSI